VPEDLADINDALLMALATKIYALIVVLAAVRFALVVALVLRVTLCKVIFW